MQELLKAFSTVLVDCGKVFCGKKGAALSHIFPVEKLLKFFGKPVEKNSPELQEKTGFSTKVFPTTIITT